MTITLTGHRPIRRSSDRPAPVRATPETTTDAAATSDEPAVYSLGSTFDDTAWAASLGCRPLFARPQR